MDDLHITVQRVDPFPMRLLDDHGGGHGRPVGEHALLETNSREHECILQPTVRGVHALQNDTTGA